MKPPRDMALAVLASAASLASCAGTAPSPIPRQEIPPMSAPSSPSRPSSPSVAPIEHQGVRYEEDRHDDRAGDQPGGYLAAIDSQTGTRLWRLKVYNIARSAPPGMPTQPLYFRAMRLSADASALEIENEAGGVYRVDLATRSSSQVSGPPETAAPKPPTSPKPKPQ